MLFKVYKQVGYVHLLKVSRSLLHLRKRHMKTLRLLSGKQPHWHNIN